MTVTVQVGQSMSSIAASHHVPLSELERDNPKVGPSHIIYAGETLNLPGEVRTYQVTMTCTETIDAQGNASLNNCATVPAPPPTQGSDDPPPTQQPTQQPAQSAPDTTGYVPVPVGSASMWACIERAESGDNPRAVNSIPGYIGNGGGLFGDLKSTWDDYDGYPQPFDAPVSVQVQFNAHLYEQAGGYGPWDDPCTGRNGG
jgi:hypothetical protein